MEHVAFSHFSRCLNPECNERQSNIKSILWPALPERSRK